MNWITMFSQTGSEIYNVSKKLNRSPDLIITNNKNLESINPNLLNEYFDRLVVVQSKPSIDEYNELLFKGAVTTMHGWLRVIPGEICEQHEIYNLHPAPLTKYPHLKGKDPQKRTFIEQLKYGGNTIHRCTAELDSGEIILEEEFILSHHTQEGIFKEIHSHAQELWVKVLSNKFGI